MKPHFEVLDAANRILVEAAAYTFLFWLAASSLWLIRGLWLWARKQVRR